MTWKDKTIARILLLIAKMLSEREELKKELGDLALHISVRCPAKESSHD